MTTEGPPVSLGGQRSDGATADAEAEVAALRDFFENGSIGLHWVAQDGTILRANRAELEMLGYTPDEYIGHSITEFHADEAAISDILDRLANGETIRDREAKMRCKDGTIKDVLIDSSVRWVDGEFAHTRCFTRDNTSQKQAKRIALQMAVANAAKDEAVAAHKLVEERLTLLIEASGQLIESLRLDEMLPRIMRVSRGLVAADAYALWTVDPVTGVWEIAGADGLSQEYLRENRIIADAGDRAAAFHDHLIIADVDDEPIVQDRLPGYRAEGIRSMLVLAVVVGGTRYGTLTFYSHTPHRFSEAEVRVATALANLVAAAIGSARAYELQEASKKRVTEANYRLRFLSEASALLAESLDYQQTLQSLSRLVVPWLADWCGVSVMEQDGTIATVAVAHADPAKVEMARELGERYPADPEAKHGVPEVFRTGSTELLEEISDEMLVESAVDEEHLQIIRSLGLTATLCVPLIAHKQVIGALSLVLTDGRRSFAQEDVALAEELARRAAAAIDNAQIYRKAQQIASDLEEAVAAKDDFLGMVSHELKTPITTILGNAEVLAQRFAELDVETRNEALNDISYESRRLYRLIENLLVLARLEAGKEVEPEPVLVRREIARVIREHERRYPHRKIVATVPTELYPVNAEPMYFEQLLQNLLSNAEKYSPPHEPIDVVVEPNSPWMEVSVRDRGPGIPPDQIDRIFEPFVRLKQTSNVAAGAGIGLAVCKRLAEVQGGSIRASAREGGGLCVTFSLPLDATNIDSFGS